MSEEKKAITRADLYRDTDFVQENHDSDMKQIARDLQAIGNRNNLVQDLKRGGILYKMFLFIREIAQAIDENELVLKHIRLRDMGNKLNIPEYTIRRKISMLTGYEIIKEHSQGVRGTRNTYVYTIIPYSKWHPDVETEFSNVYNWK